MPDVSSTTEQLRAWREDVARLFLTGISWGLPVVGLVLGVSRGVGSPVLLLAFFWAILVLVRVFATARVQATAMMGVLVLSALGGFTIFGLSGGPTLSGAAGFILAAALFGRRVALIMLGVVSVLALLVGLAASHSQLPFLDAAVVDPTRFSNWLRLILFFALAIGVLIVALSRLLERLEAAWRATAAAAERERHEHQQRLQAEAERHAAEERAAQAQRLEAVGRLAGGVAHDFNNLLVVILSWTDLLARARGEAERQEGISAIRDAGTQAAQLIRQLLSFARKDLVRPRAVDVDEAVATTLKSLRRLLPGDVELLHVPGATAQALVDEAQLGQVLLNLAANARDAMPRGGRLTLTTAVVSPPQLPPEAPDPTGRYVTLTVADTGDGMDDETRAHVFEPFFTTKERGRGTGLGLASVFGVATQGGGWVTVDSAPGLGTRVTVGFPQAMAAAKALPVEARPAPDGDATKQRVLLVEDDRAVRHAMARTLRGAGLEVQEAASADEALTLARRSSGAIDLLCTDGVMPGAPTQVLIDGFRQLFPQAPVLVCSGYVEEELLRRGISEGAVEVLPKPFTAEKLVSRVQGLLEKVTAPPADALPLPLGRGVGERGN